MKDKLVNHRNQLVSDRKLWYIEQIKLAMTMGQRSIRTCILGKKQYKSAKTLFNFWKKIPENELPY